MVSSQRVSIKQSNRKVILDMFRDSSVLSVADVSSKTGISKPTVQKVINHFTQSGYILPEGKGVSTDEGGKKPLLYSFNQIFGYSICIHLGPDFLYSAIIDMKSNVLHFEDQHLERIAVQDVIRMCADVIDRFSQNELVSGSPLVSVAIALPGIVNPEDGTLVFTPHFPEWGNDFRFIDELRKYIAISVPVHCDNINRFQAFAEMTIGRAINKKNFLIIDAMEEGLGSGIVVNGQIKHGSQNFSGEIGHMLLMPVAGPQCICGGKGCFEALVSLRRINELIHEGRTRHKESLIFTKENELPLLERLFNAFNNDDEFATVIMDEIAFWFASGINNVIMVNDPELIILEGIYTSVGKSFINLIKYHLERLSYPGIPRMVNLEISTFGRERGIIGAGAYSVWAYFNRPELYSN
jgi:predicted NBD/HSP70 family sugar kinase